MYKQYDQLEVTLDESTRVFVTVLEVHMKDEYYVVQEPDGTLGEIYFDQDNTRKV